MSVFGIFQIEIHCGKLAILCFISLFLLLFLNGISSLIEGKFASSLGRGFEKSKLRMLKQNLDQSKHGLFGWSSCLKVCDFVQLKVSFHLMVSREQQEDIINSINS